MATIFNILIRTNIRRQQREEGKRKLQQLQALNIENALQRIFASKTPGSRSTRTRTLPQVNTANYVERSRCMLQQHGATAKGLQQHYTQVQQLASAQQRVDQRSKEQASKQSAARDDPQSGAAATIMRRNRRSRTMHYDSSSSGSGGSCACGQDAATLELKRRSPFGGAKLLQVGVTLDDARSLLYLTLLALIYCSVLIRASAATATASATLVKAAAVADTDAVAVAGVASGVAPLLSDTVRQQQQHQHTTVNTNTTITPATATRKRRRINTDPNYNQMQRKDASTKMRRRRDAANVPGTHDDDDSNYHDDEFDEYDALINNKSAKGKYIGAPCNEMRCEPTLLHVACDRETLTCGCEKNYPVKLEPTKGCDKPKKLGEQCFYHETCMYSDENSLCVQVQHNALCQCADGFHSVSYTKPTRRVFCTQDLKELSSDLPTLLGVSTGIAVLAGLICMVLHLFSKTKYPRHRNFGDANLPPPIMYSSDTGIPLTVQSGRPSSRSSIRSSGSIGSYGNRRSSSGGLPLGGGSGAGGPGGSGIGNPGGGGGGGSTSGSKGILVSTSRTGAARSAAILLISCHISATSKQNSRATSCHTSANSRDNLDENGSEAGSRSCGSGSLSNTRQLQKQLNHQRQLLSLELSPAKSRDHDRIRTLLGMNGIDNYRTDDDDLNSLDMGNHLRWPTPASETPRFALSFNGSRRPSLASVHSTSSSVRSYSMMRFEKEAQQKEIRQEMKLRLARLQQQQHLNQNKPQIVIGDTLLHHGALGRITMTATPSPLTPNSTDELLPAVDELQEYPIRSMETTTSEDAAPVASATLTTIRNCATTSANAVIGAGGPCATVGLSTSSAMGSELGAVGGASYIGPCSSSTEAL